MIKERKRAARDDGVPAKKRKVTPDEIDAEMETAVLDEKLVENMFDELVSKRAVGVESFVKIEHGNILNLLSLDLLRCLFRSARTILRIS